MKLTHENYDQLSVLTLRGDMTAEATEEVRRSAQARFGENVHDFVIDLSGVEFVDSKGLETLLWLQEQCGERLGQVRLAAPADNVRKILEITRLSPRFDTHADVDSAIKSLR
ncbi:MAG: STAS domain-containing protein [Planctomycetes bacterium]|nr:STAS domain-containing protein [Planctomycetota bacterium]